MNALLDWIQKLRDCADDVGRARWLLSVPLIVLLKYRPIVESNLEAAGDELGLNYLAFEIENLRAGRVAGNVMAINFGQPALISRARLETTTPTEL